MSKKILLWLGCMFLGGAVFSQADVQLSQHMFNRMNYNPAVTGASRYVNVSGYLRDQWTGWEGAPQTEMITVHNFFNAINSGLGVVFIHDAIGLEKSMNFKINYAYHVKLSEGSYLSLGLGAGVLHRYFDFGNLSSDDMNDIFLPTNVKNKTYADFDFGMEYNLQNLRIGASVTHLTRSSKKATPLVAGRHYYGFIAYRQSVHPRWDIEPSLFVQQNKLFLYYEINVLTHYNDRFWFGASFRVDRHFQGKSFVPMLGADLNEYFRLGYSYDAHLGKLHAYSEGTHEIVLGIRIRKKPYRYSKSPRFFE